MAGNYTSLAYQLQIFLGEVFRDLSRVSITMYTDLLRLLHLLFDHAHHRAVDASPLKRLFLAESTLKALCRTRVQPGVHRPMRLRGISLSR